MIIVLALSFVIVVIAGLLLVVLALGLFLTALVFDAVMFPLSRLIPFAPWSRLNGY